MTNIDKVAIGGASGSLDWSIYSTFKSNDWKANGLAQSRRAAVRNPDFAETVTIRIPVLYGEVEFPEESAANGMIIIVKNSASPMNINHHSIRTPTHVLEVSRSLFKIGEYLIKKTPDFHNILHISNSNVYTEYEICQLIGKILGASIDHLKPELE